MGSTLGENSWGSGRQDLGAPSASTRQRLLGLAQFLMGWV